MFVVGGDSGGVFRIELLKLEIEGFRALGFDVVFKLSAEGFVGWRAGRGAVEEGVEVEA